MESHVPWSITCLCSKFQGNIAIKTIRPIKMAIINEYNAEYPAIYQNTKNIKINIINHTNKAKVGTIF